MSHLFIGVEGLALSDREREWIAREDVGGVIFFKRNIAELPQFLDLVAAVREIDPEAILSIDQEGGRIQRIGAPCTVLPALRAIGDLWEDDPEEAMLMAMTHAQLMASEMLALGLDLSYAPVLDIDGPSKVIGDRAFHPDPDVVKELGRVYVKGMHDAGMAACGKHFPGHGSVVPDTHNAPACDERDLTTIARCDLKPFQVAVMNGLDAVMMAHVSYPCLDERAAGYSAPWVEFLRERMRFEGAIISDDLGMAAAIEAGDIGERLRATLEAGCDFALVCRPQDVAELFAQSALPPAGEDRRTMLRRRKNLDWASFASSTQRTLWQETLQIIDQNG